MRNRCNGLGGLMAGAVALALGGGALGQPVNDNCANAVAVSGGCSVAFDLSTATADQGAPIPSCGFSGGNSHSIWYRYTAPVSGPVAVGTCASAFDSVLSVWTGTCA